MSGRRARRFLLEPQRRVPPPAEPSEFDVANAKAARRRARSVLAACRDLIRAVEDLEPMDRLGLLPDAAERFSAAADDLREQAGKLRHTLDDVTANYRVDAPLIPQPGLSGNTALNIEQTPLSTDEKIRRHFDQQLAAAVPDDRPKPGQHLKLGNRGSTS